jgi:N-acetylmuramoyl-L-alanine amidase
MLSDLKRDFKRDESVALAHYVQNALVSDMGKIHKKIVNLGVKQAMFYVLMGASMPPSILAEVSFISNPEEERLLSQESYRSAIASSLASGIKTYIATSPSIQQVAYSRKR